MAPVHPTTSSCGTCWATTESALTLGSAGPSTWSWTRVLVAVRQIVAPQQGCEALIGFSVDRCPFTCGSAL
eukprot:551493-Prymnesium_polylepis.1